jgi:hypothetical protein
LAPTYAPRLAEAPPHLGTAETASTAPAAPGRSDDTLRPRPLGGRIFSIFLTLIWLGVAAAALVSGLRYYAMPLQQRAFSDLHDLFKPSGLIGHSFGVVGSLMMFLGVGMYSLRKRAHVLARVGKLNYWLQFHIFLCTLGPFLVLLHTSFKFGGIVSIAFWSMTAVVLSGVFGRYVYVRIPQTINGQFISLRAIQKHKDYLIETITARSGLPGRDVAQLLTLAGPRKPKGLLGALFLPVLQRLTRRSQRKKIERSLALRNVPADARQTLIRLIEEEGSFEQQIVLLNPFQRLFGLWHMFHLPLAVVMLLIMVVHVVVAVLFGYAWLL